MYKFRDKFPCKEYRKKYGNLSKEEISDKELYLVYIGLKSIEEDKKRFAETIMGFPLIKFNSKDYLETIKRKDR